MAAAATTLESLPPEVLGCIFGQLTRKQLLANSAAILRTNRLFYRIGLDEVQKSLELNMLDLIHLQEPEVERVRHIRVGLNGFEQCCHYHSLCGRRVFHCPHTGKFSTARGFVDFINDRLGRLVPMILCKAANLQSFSLQAYCAQLAVSPAHMHSGESFIRPQSIISIIHGLGAAAAAKLTELTLDTDCSEEGSWTPARGIGDKCEGHVCPVIAKTLASLPKLRKLRLRRRDICPQILPFYDNNTNVDDGKSWQRPETAASTTTTPPAVLQNLESITVNLRLSELQCTGDSVWAAQSRHCQCHCPCESCFRASELVHGCSFSFSSSDAVLTPHSSTSTSASTTSLSSLSSSTSGSTATTPVFEGGSGLDNDNDNNNGHSSATATFNTAAAAGATASLSAADKFEQWRHWRYLEQKQNQSMFEEMLAVLGRAVAVLPNVKNATVLGYKRPQRELANAYREPIVGSISIISGVGSGKDGDGNRQQQQQQEVHVRRDEERAFASVW